MPAMNAGGPVIAAPVPAVPAVIANPSAGAAVIMSPFSGPKGSPFDALKYPALPANPVPGDRVADVTNTSTGGLSTGIGFGFTTDNPNGISAGLLGAGQEFTDDYIPGVSYNILGQVAIGVATDSRLVAIGGGRSLVTPVKTGDYSNTLTTPNPYNAQPLLAFGNDGSRDAGAGPAFTGFGMKVVTAAAPVAVAGVIETGFTNRTGAILPTGNSALGSSTTASTAPA